MASSITLDVSGLTQQLVAAVTAGMAKVQQEMSKQEMSKSGANSNALDKTGIINLVGIRAQIVGTLITPNQQHNDQPKLTRNRQCQSDLQRQI